VTPTEVYKAQELVYELKMSEVMTRDVLTAEPVMTMREVKSVLRDRRISGLPVVAGDALIGIVSIEDLIRALEQGQLDSPVAQFMTTHLHAIREDETVVRALAIFTATGVGRLLVVDADGGLAGIVTPGDITRGLLTALQTAYHEEEVRRYRASHIFEDIASDRTSLILRYEVQVRDFQRAGGASSRLKKTLTRMRIDPRIVRRVAIVSYEAEMNIVIHSMAGGRMVVEVNPELITVVACDSGPGILDVKRAMEPGFSTAPDWIREMGFGAGMGLSNIQTCADEMLLDSSPLQGTRVEMTIRLKPAEERISDEAWRDCRSTGTHN
jgi:CBS domain-containing protein/anti-sigma regulatory factor (Ser/Thr protein kinase)